jgi:hypothetical protein
MRRQIIAPILAAIALGFSVFAAAGIAPSRGAAPSTPPRSTGSAPLSEAATIHRWFSQPGTRQPELAAAIVRLRAAAQGAPSRATPGAAATPLAADVFNHDTDGLPQNEESVTVCGRTVLGGTNDFRGFLLTPPQEPAAGWHLSTDGGRTLRNEGLLPPVTIAGQPVPALGDPVDVAGKDCSLYASSVNSTPDDRIQAIAVYRSRPDTLASCAGGLDAACWPTRRAVATAGPTHFLDKEWMDVGRSARAGEVAWVSFTDFILDPTTGAPLSSTIKAVRCNPALTACTDPILVSGGDQRTQFSHITVGPDGRTYLSWIDFQDSPEIGQTMVIKVRVAPSASTEFGPTRIVATETMPMVGLLHANSYVEGATTIPKNDVKMVHGHPRLFVVWEGCLARPAGVVCEEPRIRLARSDDFGRSWRRTVLSVGGDNYYPTISENRGGPTLAAAWYTNRHDRRFHSRQDVELASVNPSTGVVMRRQRLTPVSNETDADPFLRGLFIGDYFEVFARRGVAYVHYNANYRFVRVLGEGFPIPQPDNYLTIAHL